MGLLDDAIREHLDLKRRRGADPAEVERLEREALAPAGRAGRSAAAALADGPADEDAWSGAAAPGPGDRDPHDAEYLDEDEAPPGAAPGEAMVEPRPVRFQPRSLRERLSRRARPNEPDPDRPEPAHGPAFASAGEELGHARETERRLPPLAPEDQVGPGTVEYQALDEEYALPEEPPLHDEHELAREELHLPNGEHDLAAGEERGTGGRAAPSGPRPHPASAPEPSEDADVLEETPEFLHETPEHDRLWFEQRPPRDFDFNG